MKLIYFIDNFFHSTLQCIFYGIVCLSILHSTSFSVDYFSGTDQAEMKELASTLLWMSKQHDSPIFQTHSSSRSRPIFAENPQAFLCQWPIPAQTSSAYQESLPFSTTWLHLFILILDFHIQYILFNFEVFHLVHILHFFSISNSMVYGTRRFNATFRRALQTFLSWAESTQFFLLIPISLRYILILASHLS